MCSALLWPVYIWGGEASAEAEAGQRGHSGSVRANNLSKSFLNVSLKQRHTLLDADSDS